MGVTVALASQSETEGAVKAPAHQHVYEKLRSQVLFGDLAPGQAVTIQGLISELGAGMTPVREAIRRLIAEGALIHQGNRRVSVPVLTHDCVQELGYMREVLEPEMARRATSRITDVEIKQLQTCDDALNQAIQKGDVGGYLTHNYMFHSIIYDVAAAPIITETIDKLWLRFGPSLRVVCGRFGTMTLPDRHADLMEALTVGDSAAAATAMSKDVAQGIKQIADSIED